MHAAARYVSVSELYSTDEVELLLDEIRDLEPTSCRGEDIQDFEIAGSGAGAAGGAGGAGSGARSPAGTERSWDSHAHYSRAPPAPPRPLAPVYCRLRYLLTASGATTLLLVACSAGAAACVWAGAGLRVWALPGAGRVRALQLGALTSAPLHAALLALHVTRLRALLPLRWPALGAAAALWSAASLLAGAAGTLLALRAPDYRAAPPALLALLRAAAGFGLGAALAALALAALSLRSCAGAGAGAGGGGAGAGGAARAGGGRGSGGSLAAYRAVPQPSTSRHEPL